MSDILKSCPFCQKPLTVRAGVNAYGRCDTPSCWMEARKIALPLDDPEQVRAWNRSALTASPASHGVVTEAMVEAFQLKYRDISERCHWGHSWPARAAARELLSAALAPAAEPQGVESHNWQKTTNDLVMWVCENCKLAVAGDEPGFTKPASNSLPRCLAAAPEQEKSNG